MRKGTKAGYWLQRVIRSHGDLSVLETIYIYNLKP